MGDTFTCCSKCKSAVKDTDAITDAVRIGQEALDKAEALQSSSEICDAHDTILFIAL